MRKLLEAVIMPDASQQNGSSAPDDVKSRSDAAGRLDKRPLWKRPVIWLLGVALAAVTGLATDTFGSFLRSWIDPDKLADRLDPSPAISVMGFERDGLLGWSTPAPVPADDADYVPVGGIGDAFGEGLPPDDALHIDWLRRHDAYALMQEDVTFTLRGERAQAVTITHMRPRLLACGPPVAGAAFYAPPEGENNVKQLAVNLDHRTPVFHEWDGLSPRSAPEPYFTGHTISLAQGEQMTFSLMAFADERSCKWHLDADVLVNGKKETITLTEASGPLSVSGPVQPTQYQDLYVLTYLLPAETYQAEPLFTRVQPPEGLCSDGEPKWCLELMWSVEDLAGYVE